MPVELKAAIQEGIDLLEARKYEAMLIRFVRAGRRDEMLKGKSLKEYVETLFSEEYAGKLLAFFKSMQNSDPELSEDGTQASFVCKEFSDYPVVFTRHGDRWYIGQ